jgi:signal transduction histidine kinase
VAVERDALSTRLVVRDSGPGIAPEMLPHIFDKFFQRSSGGQRDPASHGLGLGLCRWIAEAHGGRIDVQSVLGHGTTFLVRLPLASGPDPDLQQPWTPITNRTSARA